MRNNAAAHNIGVEVGDTFTDVGVQPAAGEVVTGESATTPGVLADGYALKSVTAPRAGRGRGVYSPARRSVYSGIRLRVARVVSRIDGSGIQSGAAKAVQVLRGEPAT